MIANTKKSSSRFKITMLVMMILLIVTVNGFLIYKVTTISKQYAEIQTEVKSSRMANERVLVMLREIKDEQQRQSDQMQDIKNVAYIKKANVMTMKQVGFSVYTDLGANSTISVEDMERIISYYSQMTNGNAFDGHAEAFIEASKETGLNPVYLFAHAAEESGFGTSYLARTRHNYFGINAVDADPGLAYAMGDDIDQGIMAGARWIKSNYYDNGYTTLNSMHNAGYATATEWANSIASIANRAIEVL